MVDIIGMGVGQDPCDPDGGGVMLIMEMRTDKNVITVGGRRPKKSAPGILWAVDVHICPCTRNITEGNTMDEKEKLQKEIDRLEKKLTKDHFGGLMDKAGRRKDENRLKKLRKELAELTGKGKKK